MHQEGEAPDLGDDTQEAIRHFSEGRLPQAKEICSNILTEDPDHPTALSMLGVIAFASGESDRALEYLARAIAVKPDYAEAHNNLGNLLRDLGRFAEAEESYLHALDLKPDFAEFHNNLGVTLSALERPEDAVASYRRAIDLKHEFAEAHSNLGSILKEIGKPEDALASYQRAIEIKPDSAEAHSNLGSALKELGRLEDAVASCRKAIAINPDFAEAHSNLGGILKDLGRLDEAFTSHRRAVSLKPQNDLFWAGMAWCLETHSFTFVDDNLLADLLRLLERPVVRPSFVTRPIIGALWHHQGFSKILDRTGSGSPEIEISYGDLAGQLSAIPLFLRILSLSPINDQKIERMLTALRRAMLQETLTGKFTEKDLPFSSALALQCFTNEYIFHETEEEKADVVHLEQQISALVDKQIDVPPHFVAALGAYRALYGFPWARELSDREWAGDIGQVIERQITEPLEEQPLRSQIPCLTAIQNAVSQSVLEQYEENPYPRWIKTDLREKGRAIGAILQGAGLHSELGDYVSPASPEILVAGCGTGQHALTTASRFSNARVLAVDLSLSSLSYALRKTHELDVSNIEYVQGDLTELGSLGRQFDLIECAGVLVCIDEPMAGWRVLVDLLRPGGLMKIGLYSELARQDVIAARALIAEKGYTTSPEDIRRCRQDIIAQGIDGDRKMAQISNTVDFFSASEVRDLIFYVKEHRFTLPQIQQTLQTLNLKFLGFEMRDPGGLKLFREANPEKGALTSLDLWHAFEVKNPNTFRGMYQFWCKKM